jgi:hypothetical protein
MPMQRRSIVFLSLALALAGGCNSSQKLGQGAISKGEALSNGPEKVADAIVSESHGVDSGSYDAPVVLADHPSAPAPSMEADEDESNNKTALEPVPIGGAYLTCRYQDGQKQASESYRMECEVAPLLEVKVPIASALFYKVDAQGNRTALRIVTQELLSLKWVVEETAATMFLPQVQVVLSAPGRLSVALDAIVSSSMQLVQNTLYWLAGEPNNLTDDEDCAEIVSFNGRIVHQDFTGLVSGPLGRMNDSVCTLNNNFLCRNISAGANAAKWTASPRAAPFSSGAMACAQGYAFGLPMTEAEVREVIQLVDRLDLKLWVNLNDVASEGTFRTMLR